MDQQHVTRQESLFRKIAGSLFCLLMFIMPLKYGTIAVMPEASCFYPDRALDYIFVSWPSASFGVFSGTVLLLVLAAFRPKTKFDALTLCALLSGVAPMIAALWGKQISSSSFYSNAAVCHISGICAAVISSAILVMNSSVWRNRILYSLGAGTFLLTLSAFHQYFIGFEDMKEFARMQEKNGIVFSEAIRLKLIDGRVYAAMSSANLLAGFMLLAAPLLVSCAAILSRKFEPQKLSLKIFCAASTVLGAGTLLMTKTRGAFLAAAVTAVIWLFSCQKIKRSVKLILCGAIAAIVILGAFYIHTKGRGFGSMGERVSYINTSLIMLCEKPLSGHGWGEFFYRHMELKNTSSNESAHNPHNTIADFAIHTGFAAGVIALFTFLYPLFKLWKRREELDELEYAILWGGTAAFLHSLTDINTQSPAVISSLLIALLVCQRSSEENRETARVRNILFAVTAAAIAITSLTANWIYLKGDAALNHLEECCSPPVREKFHLSTPGNVRRAIEQVQKLRPDHPFAFSNGGNYFMAHRDYETAEMYFNNSLKLDPRRPGVLRKLADIAELKGDAAKAQELRLKAHKLFPSNPEYKLK